MKISSFFTFKNWHPDFGLCQPPIDSDQDNTYLWRTRKSLGESHIADFVFSTNYYSRILSSLERLARTVPLKLLFPRFKLHVTRMSQTIHMDSNKQEGKHSYQVSLIAQSLLESSHSYDYSTSQEPLLYTTQTWWGWKWHTSKVKLVRKYLQSPLTCINSDGIVPITPGLWERFTSSKEYRVSIML
jgi:hypothetical protein